MPDLKNRILANKSKLPTDTVEAFGETLTVRGMTAGERDRFEKSLIAIQSGHPDQAQSNVQARVMQWCTVDDDGTRVFEGRDIDRLADLPAGDVRRVYDKVLELTKVDDDLETTAGNSSTTPSGSSSSN
ncbi:MAG: hypothetical protein AAGE65_13710 [Planctomycetota bacterium]